MPAIVIVEVHSHLKKSPVDVEVDKWPTITGSPRRNFGDGSPIWSPGWRERTFGEGAVDDDPMALRGGTWDGKWP